MKVSVQISVQPCRALTVKLIGWFGLSTYSITVLPLRTSIWSPISFLRITCVVPHIMLWSVPTQPFAVQKYTVTVVSAWISSPLAASISTSLKQWGPCLVLAEILPWVISCCFPFSFSPAAEHFRFFAFPFSTYGYPTHSGGNKTLSRLISMSFQPINHPSWPLFWQGTFAGE